MALFPPRERAFVLPATAPGSAAGAQFCPLPTGKIAFRFSPRDRHIAGFYLPKNRSKFPWDF
jgi:hypothetical protein